jgi:hypothetical protein
MLKKILAILVVGGLLAACVVAQPPEAAMDPPAGEQARMRQGGPRQNTDMQRPGRMQRRGPNMMEPNARADRPGQWQNRANRGPAAGLDNRPGPMDRQWNRQIQPRRQAPGNLQRPQIRNWRRWNRAPQPNQWRCPYAGGQRAQGMMRARGGWGQVGPQWRQRGPQAWNRPWAGPAWRGRGQGYGRRGGQWQVPQFRQGPWGGRDRMREQPPLPGPERGLRGQGMRRPGPQFGPQARNQDNWQGGPGEFRGPRAQRQPFGRGQGRPFDRNPDTERDFDWDW